MGTGTGEGPPVRWENGGRRRRRMDGDDDDDDEEYVVEEEEEEDYAEELSASSAGEEGEDSDAEYQVDEEEEEVDTPRPTRPAKGGDRGRKGKADLAAARSRRRKYEEDEDYEEEVDEDDEEAEEYHDEFEEEDEEEAPPRPKRPAKPRGRGRNVELSPVAERSQPWRHRDDMGSDPELDDMDFDPELDDEVEEEEERPQRPKSLVKCHRHDRDVELSPVAERSHQRRCKDDTDFDPELDDTDFDPELDDEEVEEEEKEALPQSQSTVKCRGRGQNVELSPVAERSHQRRREVDMDFDPELDDEEVEEENEALPRPKSLAKSRHRGQNVELSPVAERSHQHRHEVDMDFDPELDDEDDEADEDIDFDPEVDVEEDEFEDEEEEELGAIRARKVTVKDPVKRKSFSKRRSQNKKKKKKSTGSKVSRKKVGSSKGSKSAPVRRRRKRTLIDHYEEDDDFIVEDQEAVSRNPRKKARTGTGRKTEVDLPVSIEEEKWPTVESDTSEFEFATSDEEPDDVAAPVVEPATVRKGRKKRRTVSESSSDSEFVVSDKELEDLRENEPPPKALPMLPTQIRRISVTRNGEDKGKKKEEPEEAGKPICGICLSEEQRATVQGVLNCCSHYFCFACIMEWSRVESRCPLCKQRFTTITKSSKVDLGLGQRKAVIRVEERDQVYQPTEEEIRRWLDPYENVVCIECNQGGDDSLMLLCDICDSSAHTYCVGLGNEVPEGNWYCGGCRLSDEGPSYTRIQHTVGYERPNYRGPVNGSSVGFGVAAPSGTFERSPSINSRRTFQGIDLNLSPTEIPGEFHPAESQVSTDGVSPPSGMRATVSGRRQIHRYIRILLAGPRQNRPEMFLNGLHNSGVVQRPEPNRHNFRSSSEANTSQVLPDGIQNQHNGLPFIQAHSNLCSKSPR